MKMFKVGLRPKAKRDIAMIQEYLSQFYTSTPKKFMKDFEKVLDRLSFSPWHKKWRSKSAYRRVYVSDRKYVVLYIVNEKTNTVRIHRILHSKRDFSRGEDIELMEERAEYRPAPKYNHIYGPMRSRRLGNSLGVDMVPHKTCSLDCVYCECGATTVLTTARNEYINTDAIISEIDDYLSGCEAPPDYVTFGGSGEPTLHSGLGKIIAHLKKRWPSQKLALLTNSTLLTDSALRKEILPCDLILPSLDAVTDEVFRKINAPADGIDCEGIIEGLTALAAEYNGDMWLEVFIAPGINDMDSEIALFKDVITKINPTRVQLNSLDRPGTCKTLAVATRASLEDIAQRLAPLTVEIVGRGA